MSETTNRVLNVFINTGEAQKALDKLTAKEKELNAQLAKTSDPKQMAQLKKELDKLQEPISRAAKKLSGELTPSVTEMQKTVKNLGNQLKHMSEQDADFSNMVKQFKLAQVELEELKIKAGQTKNAFEQTQKTNPFGRVMEYAKGTLLGGGIQWVVQQFAGFLGDSINEALSAEDAGARFQSTLDNLGHSDAFDRIISKADELAAKFKYLDNDDIVGVFNKLVDYGHLTEQQMNNLLPVIINFAAKQRISIEEATGVILKALEGNGKALKEYGIQLDSTGTRADNLNVVMTTLSQKVEGAAEAFEKTAGGSIAETKQQFANLKEEVGNQLVPVLVTLLSWLNKVMTGLGYLKGKLGNAVSDIKALFTGGFAGVGANWDARDAQHQADINNQVVQNKVNSMSGKSKADIDAEIEKTKQLISFKEKLLKAQQRLVAEGASDQEEVAKTKNAVSILKQELQALQQMGKDSGNVLGLGGEDQKEKSKQDAAAKAAAAAQKKALDSYQALMKELQKMQNELDLFDKGAREKQFIQVEEKYNELREKAKGHKDAMLLVEKMYQQEMWQLQVTFARQDLDAFAKAEKEKEAAQQKAMQEGLQRAQKHLAEMVAAMQKAAQAQSTNYAAGLQVQLMGTNPFSSKRLELQKKLLEYEMQQELATKDLTENQKLLLEQQYRQKAKEAEQQHWQNLVGTIMQFAQQALGVLQQFSESRTAQENRDLDKDKKVNEAKKANLKRQLDGKRITQMEYDRQTAELDKKQEAKEKQVRLQQFKRQQRMAVVNALINGAQGVQKSIAEWGMPFALPWIALTAAMTAAQIAAISKQTPPEFARGGFLSGPSHQSATRGMPVVNPVTGQTQALVEGGEAITNKHTMADRGRYTVSGTPSQIISALNGMHGGVTWNSGATLVPAWRTTRPARMDFAHINDSIRTVRLFAAGGVFPGGAAPASTGGDDSHAVLGMMVTVLSSLQQTLENGIQAPVLLSDIENAAARKAAILKEATMKA